MDECEKKRDWNHYSMKERLKLAKIVSENLKDKNGLVVELGSEKGGMSYALLRERLRVLSVENDFENYLTSKLVNENAVLEDAFDFKPEEKAAAVVSYMFLGACMPGKSDTSETKEAGKRNAERVRQTFESLAEHYRTGTFYSVELQRELYGWFGWHALDKEQIEKKMKEALPGWEVESLGEFGVFVGGSYDDIEDRLGFKFVKKNEDGKRE